MSGESTNAKQSSFLFTGIPPGSKNTWVFGAKWLVHKLYAKTPSGKRQAEEISTIAQKLLFNFIR